MNVLEIIKSEDIFFINVDRLAKASVEDNEGFLEYFIWEKPKGVNITGYRIRQRLSEAHESLRELKDSEIPSNFLIVDLYDQEFLSAIGCKESWCSEQLGEQELVKIELVADKNCLHNFLFELCVKDAQIKVTGGKGFSVARNLSFNKDNNDVVFRQFIEGEGFKSYHLLRDGFIPDMYVRSSMDLNIPYTTMTPAGSGIVEYFVEGKKLNNSSPELYLNGEKIDNLFVITLLTVETLAVAFNDFYMVELGHKVHEAVNRFMNNLEQDSFKFLKSNSVGGRIIKTCTVSAEQPYVPITKITSMLAQNKFDGSEESILRCHSAFKSLYGEQMAYNICLFLMDYNGCSERQLKVSSAIHQISSSQEKATKGLFASFLKQTFTRNRLFRQMFGNGGNYYECNTLNNVKLFIDVQLTVAEVLKNQQQQS